MNFAYVRSLISLILASLAVVAVAAASPASADSSQAPAPRVTFALLPQGTGPAAIGRVEGLAPGLLTAGIGGVPAAQTYLDIGQGNRVSQTLYDGDTPFVRFTANGVAPANWDAIESRAEGAPADIVPGLFASTLAEEGVTAIAGPDAGLGRLIAADREGRVARSARACRGPGCGAVRVISAEASDLERLVAGVRGQDLVIAIERPPPGFRTLAIGIAGAGYDGALTSDSTRTEGLVTTTDVAPTVLSRLGIETPGAMNGEPITAEGDTDAGDLVELEGRLRITGERRGPVIGQTLLAWAAFALLAVAIGRRPAARVSLSLLALSVIYLPLVLLLTPAFDPSLLAERLAAGLGAPALALATWRLLGGWRALGAACLLTVGGYAADVLAGSVLIPLSIPGPNPASGSRFYGIGNEIEATVSVLLPIGVGALLASSASMRQGGRGAAGVFLAAGFAGAAAFALGRFGADVGAAIVLPAGAAVAAAVSLGTRRGIALVVLVPIAALVALMAADLLFGGEAHLTRSLLDAGGLDAAGDVFERRIRLAAFSFTRTANLPFLALALVAVAAGVWKRREVGAWFPERAALAGFAGAIAATALGTVSNDSGVILLILGAAYCAAIAGYAWALR